MGKIDYLTDENFIVGLEKYSVSSKQEKEINNLRNYCIVTETELYDLDLNNSFKKNNFNNSVFEKILLGIQDIAMLSNDLIYENNLDIKLNNSFNEESLAYPWTGIVANNVYNINGKKINLEFQKNNVDSSYNPEGTYSYIQEVILLRENARAPVIFEEVFHSLQFSYQDNYDYKIINKIEFGAYLLVALLFPEFKEEKIKSQYHGGIFSIINEFEGRDFSIENLKQYEFLKSNNINQAIKQIF